MFSSDVPLIIFLWYQDCSKFSWSLFKSIDRYFFWAVWKKKMLVLFF